MSRHSLSVLLGLLFPVFALAVSAFALMGCGDDGPQCVIDTDCPLGQRCASDMTCQPVLRIDAALEIDAGPPPTDAGGGGDGNMDAAQPVDGGSDEGGMDAGRM
jgi:hypothetical protein